MKIFECEYVLTEEKVTDITHASHCRRWVPLIKCSGSCMVWERVQVSEPKQKETKLFCGFDDTWTAGDAKSKPSSNNEIMQMHYQLHVVWLEKRIRAELNQISGWFSWWYQVWAIFIYLKISKPSKTDLHSLISQLSWVWY